MHYHSEYPHIVLVLLALQVRAELPFPSSFDLPDIGSMVNAISTFKFMLPYIALP
jgi:hypothetical protein